MGKQAGEIMLRWVGAPGGASPDLEAEALDRHLLAVELERARFGLRVSARRGNPWPARPGTKIAMTSSPAIWSRIASLARSAFEAAWWKRRSRAGRESDDRNAG